MFIYGKKNSYNNMQTTWEKPVQHIGIDIGQDISTELQKKSGMLDIALRNWELQTSKSSWL